MGVIKEIQEDLEAGARRLFSEYHSRLLAEARSLCSDSDSAEDLVMLTLETYFAKPEKYDSSKGELMTWLKAVMRNHFRKSLRRKSHIDTIFLPADDLQVVAERLQAGEAQTEPEGTESDELIRRAVASLSPKVRDAVILHYFKGQPVDKTASALGISVEAAKNRLFCARQILHARLKGRLGKSLAVLAALLFGVTALFGAYQLVKVEEVEEQGSGLLTASEKESEPSASPSVSFCAAVPAAQNEGVLSNDNQQTTTQQANATQTQEKPTMKLTQTFAAAALAVTAAVGTDAADGNDEKTFPLKYIECTGEQWVDIDFTPTATTIVEMDVDFTDDTGACHNTLYCSRSSDASHPFSLYALGGNLGWRFDYGVMGANVGLRYPAATLLHINASANGFYTNEVQLLSAPSGDSFVPEGKMMLFASYSGGFGDGVANYAKLRCWAVVLRDSADATFVRVLLPYSVNGRACLRDMKTGTPYYSGSEKDLVPGDDDCQLLRVTGAPLEIGQPTPAYGLTLVEGTVATCKAERVVHCYWGKTSCTLIGWRQYCMTGAGWTRNRTGSGSECCVVTTNGPCWVDWRYRVRSRMSKLPGEYEELAYVQSDGRQYFDTRYAPKAETRVVARYRLTRSGEWPHYIFGCQDGTCRFKFSHSNADGKGAIFGYDESVSTDVNPKIRDDAMDHVVDVSNGVFRVDGETAWTAGAPWSASGNSSSIYLFASHEVVSGKPVGHCSSTAIGGFTIYEDNAVVHDFVPCRRKSDGAVGFYDRKATQDPFRTGESVPLGAGPALVKSNAGLCIMVY